MKLEDIGFYTLCDERARHVSDTSPMWRCELIVTDRCNFHCPYCRGLPNCKGEMHPGVAQEVLKQWCDQGLQNVRFSGGEPLTYPWLKDLVWYCYQRGVKRIAISSNGSFPIERYRELICQGVNDFSISLDACCSAFGDRMAGVPGKWEQVVSNIRTLAQRVYTTVGVVLTTETAPQVCKIVQFAHDLGVADIRLIPAAQESDMIAGVQNIPNAILNAHPILRYRVQNLLAGRPVRGLTSQDSHACYLVQDDSIVAGDSHYPCPIYLREQGEPIGKISPIMRAERLAWFALHDTYKDPICRRNCLDICIDHNNFAACYRETA